VSDCERVVDWRITRGKPFSGISSKTTEIRLALVVTIRARATNRRRMAPIWVSLPVELFSLVLAHLAVLQFCGTLIFCTGLLTLLVEVTA